MHEPIVPFLLCEAENVTFLDSVHFCSFTPQSHLRKRNIRSSGEPWSVTDHWQELNPRKKGNFLQVRYKEPLQPVVSWPHAESWTCWGPAGHSARLNSFKSPTEPTLCKLHLMSQRDLNQRVPMVHCSMSWNERTHISALVIVRINKAEPVKRMRGEKPSQVGRWGSQRRRDH